MNRCIVWHVARRFLWWLAKAVAAVIIGVVVFVAICVVALLVDKYNLGQVAKWIAMVIGGAFVVLVTCFGVWTDLGTAIADARRECAKR